MNKLLLSLTMLSVLTLTHCGKMQQLGLISQPNDIKSTEPKNENIQGSTWIKVTEDSYKSYIKINEGAGFFCFTDGKTGSFHFNRYTENGKEVIEGKSDFGTLKEELILKTNQLLIKGSEKGVSYTTKFVPTKDYPEVCERMERGEEVDFEELKKTWKSFMIGKWNSVGADDDFQNYHLNINADATGELCLWQDDKLISITSITVDFNYQEIIGLNMYIGVDGDQHTLQKLSDRGIDVELEVIQNETVPEPCLQKADGEI